MAKGTLTSKVNLAYYTPSTWHIYCMLLCAVAACAAAEAAGLPGRVGGKDNSSGSRAKRQSSGCPPVAAAHQQQQQQQYVANGSAAQHNGNGIANGAHALLNGA